MITMKDWRVGVPYRENIIGYERDHLFRRLEIATDLGPEWSVKLDVRREGRTNVIDLEWTGKVLYVDLTREMLGADGLYTAQLRGVKGEVVAHSNLFTLIVSEAINGIDAFPPLEPSEMAQMEAKMTQAKEAAQAAAEAARTVSLHPAKLSSERTWLVWDTEMGGYVDTGVTATGEKGPKGSKGDSPYQVAAAGGYTGTEADFNGALSALGDIGAVLDAINGEVI